MASLVATVRKFVTVAPDVQLFSERLTLKTNKNPKETIIFVHGLGGNMNSLFPLLPAILRDRPEATLLAFDWSGSGLSPYPAKSRPAPSFHDFITDFAKFIELEAPEGPLTIISHSAGTPLTIRLLTLPSINFPHASRVTALVFIGGPMPVAPSGPALEAQKNVVQSILQDGVVAVVDTMVAMLTSLTTIKQRPVAIALTRSILLSNNNEAYAAGLKAILQDGGDGPYQWDRLPKGAKVLFIGGKEDVILAPGLLEASAREVAGSKIVIFSDAGHSPAIEVPEESGKAIVEFLRN